MRWGSYEVVVPEGQETAEGHVILQHGQHYRIRLHNGVARRCDAQLEVDGKLIDTFRLNAFDYCLLERPPKDSQRGRWTFYKADSQEGQMVGLQAGSPDCGLIKVTFTPEIEMYQRASWLPPYHPWIIGQPAPYTVDASSKTMPVPVASYACNARGVEGLQAGGTGLSGYSGQNFCEVPALNLDHSQAVTIMLRLVAGVASAAMTPRPLLPRSTPVPAMVGK